MPITALIRSCSATSRGRSRRSCNYGHHEHVHPKMPPTTCHSSTAFHAPLALDIKRWRQQRSFRTHRQCHRRVPGTSPKTPTYVQYMAFLTFNAGVPSFCCFHVSGTSNVRLRWLPAPTKINKDRYAEKQISFATIAICGRIDMLLRGLFIRIRCLRLQ